MAQSSQFSLDGVQVISATVDLDEIINYRGGIVSRGYQAAKKATQISIIELETKNAYSKNLLTTPIKLSYLEPSEEIRFGPACWLWDYCRRSKQNGFFLALSGGLDSCSTALIVYSMCQMVFHKVETGDASVIDDLRKMVKDEEFKPKSSQEICGYINLMI